MNVPRRSAGDQRGVSFVEFAIALPLLLIVVFGLWELGRVFDAWLVVTNASREGARYAIAGSTNSEVTTQVVEYVTTGKGSGIGLGNIKNSSIVVTVQRPYSTGEVTVTVKGDLDVWAPRIPGITEWIPDEFEVSSSTVMRQ